MSQEKFDNAFLLLIIASVMMITLIYSNDVQKLKNIEPEVVTVIETEYVYLECDKEHAETSTDETASVETRTSRGGDVETPAEEPIVEATIEPIIQPIDYNFDIMTPSNFTSEDLAEALNTTSHEGILHLVDYFVEAEQTYGINSLYLMSTIGWESGWGEYRSNTNNLAGWKDPNTGGFRSFNSEYECIMTVAEEVSTLWTSAVGSSLEAITSRYCPTPGYTESIMTIMEERQNQILY